MLSHWAVTEATPWRGEPRDEKEETKGWEMNVQKGCVESLQWEGRSAEFSPTTARTFFC